MVVEKKVLSQPDIPDYLIREIIGGEPFYFRGYKAVLSKEKPFEAIAIISVLHAFIATYVTMLFAKQQLYDRYTILAGGPGLTINPDNHLVCSMLFFDLAVFTPDKIATRYADMPPVLALMIDDIVDVSSDLHSLYMRKKVDALLCFGAQKVIWILTNSRQVIVAIPNEPWLTYDWNESIELLDGINFNIGDYLKNEGVKLPE